MKCPSCSAIAPEGANFCGNCGTSLRDKQPETAGGIEETISDRRPLTIMFCDLVGSTALSESLDPEDLQEILLEYQRVCGEVVERFDGYIAQYLGDGILVYFGYPRAHEDDARRAVLSGLGMLDAMASLNASGPADRGPLQIRIGIHTGLVVTGEIGHGTKETVALGQTPNIAARIQSMTAPDTIAVSAATQALTSRQIRYEPLGAPLMKGVSEPIDLFQVAGTIGAAGPTGDADRHFGKAVGRQLEVDAILDCWQQTLSGAQRTVLISGEPGIGKSRLVAMARDGIDDGASHWCVSRCSPYSERAAFAPFAELVRERFAIDPGASPEEQVAALSKALDEAGCNTDSIVAGVRDVLDLDGEVPLPPDQRKQQVIASLCELFRAPAAAKPLVLVVEDLHWADSSTIDLLKALDSEDSGARILLLLTFRPTFESPFEEGSTARFFKLDRLRGAEIRELIESAAAPAKLADDIVQLIADRADGVPLFAEELAHMLIESDQLRLEDDVFVVRASLDDLSLPSTIHSSLVARLDKLGPARKVVQLASVMGREFNIALLASVSEFDHGTLKSHLDTLVELRIVTQAGEDDSATYNFRHALIRDAAYGTLLKRDKAEIHGRIAGALTEYFPDLSETRPEAIAYHYSRANEPHNALEFWQRAGQRSAERFANAEAIKHYANALEMIDKLPESETYRAAELALQTALGAAVSIHHGWQADEAGSAFERAFELCQALPDAPEQFWVLWQLAAHYLTRDIDKTREISEQLIRLAEIAGSPDLLVEAQFSVAAVALLTGQFAEARDVLSRAEQIIESELDASVMSPTGQNMAVNVLLYLGLVYVFTGEPAAGFASIDRGIHIAREHAGPPHQASALAWRAFNQIALGTPENVLEISEEAIELSENSLVGRYWSLMVHGWALAHAGQTEQAIATTRKAFDEYHAAGIRSLEPWMLTIKADTLLVCDAIEECLATVEAGFVAVADIGESFSAAELHRIKAEALAAKRNYEAAAAAFEMARDVALEQGAKMLALKASLAYARMLAARGMRSQAHAKLDESCRIMTDTAEFRVLREAREFLAHLA